MAEFQLMPVRTAQCVADAIATLVDRYRSAFTALLWTRSPCGVGRLGVLEEVRVTDEAAGDDDS